MKKKLSILVLCMLLVMSIVGCSKTDGDDVVDANDSNESNEVNESKETVEVEFWHGIGGALGDSLQEIIDAYNESQDDYFVKAVVYGSYTELSQQLQSAYAANTVPALVAADNVLETFYTRGLVEPIENYLPDSYDYDDVVGGFLNSCIRDDQFYFAPAYGTSQVLYYNNAVLEEAGYSVEDLSTWQSIVEMQSDIIGIDTNHDTIAYVWEPMQGAENMVDAVFSAGGQVISDDGTQVLINDDIWVEVWDQFRSWIHDDEIMRVHYGGQGWEYWYKTMDDWVYGKSLGYTGSPGDYAIALDAVTEAIEDGYKNEFAVAIQPGWGDHEPNIQFSSINYMIPLNSALSEEEKYGAGDFVAFATSPENTAKFAMETGYVAVKKSALELPEYQEYLEVNPGADIPLLQIDEYGVPEFSDPTGGAIWQALSNAAEKVQVENIDAKTALDEAQEIAQKELDNYNQQ